MLVYANMNKTTTVQDAPRIVLTSEDVARGGRNRWKNVSKEERSRRMKNARNGKPHTAK